MMLKGSDFEIPVPSDSPSVSDPGFFPDPDQNFFSESGSGSAKNPDPIRKNPDP